MLFCFLTACVSIFDGMMLARVRGEPAVRAGKSGGRFSFSIGNQVGVHKLRPIFFSVEKIGLFEDGHSLRIGLSAASTSADALNPTRCASSPWQHRTSRFLLSSQDSTRTLSFPLHPKTKQNKTKATGMEQACKGSNLFLHQVSNQRQREHELCGSSGMGCIFAAQNGVINQGEIPINVNGNYLQLITPLCYIYGSVKQLHCKGRCRRWLLGAC